MRLEDIYYERIKKIVVALFQKYNIHSIPIDCYEICTKMDIILKSYTTVNKKRNIHATAFSEDGFCFLVSNTVKPSTDQQWCILYNDTRPKERIRFTIMHEIGHIVLNHTEDSELADSEANFFAKYALAPPPLVNRIKPDDYLDIATHFNISQECAYYAMDFYNKWLRYGNLKYHDYELSLLSLFKDAE